MSSPLHFSPRTPTRECNDLIDKGSFLIKSSTLVEKILAEARYYQELPPELHRFHPKYMGLSAQGRWPDGYALEKIPSWDASLYEVGLVSRRDDYFHEFLTLIKEYLSLVHKKQVTQAEWLQRLEELIFTRDRNRIEQLKATPYFSEVDQIFDESGESSLSTFTDKLHASICERSAIQTHWPLWASHGDLCLSNIIIHEHQIFLVDPRGNYTHEDGFLIPHYDFAKMSQCLMGGYDYINHDCSEQREYGRAHESMMHDLMNTFSLDLMLVRLVEASHFIAMLPLHVSHPKRVVQYARQAIKTYREAIG